MAEANLFSKLSTLESSAKTLNTFSDEVNRLLKTFETRLVEANIGLEVWLSVPLSRKEAQREGGTQSVVTERRLGFARINGTWCIAVKGVRTRFGYFEGDTNCPWEDEHLEEAPIPIANASREERIKALEQLSKFIEELESETHKAIKTIENAKRIA